MNRTISLLASPNVGAALALAVSALACGPAPTVAAGADAGSQPADAPLELADAAADATSGDTASWDAPAAPDAYFTFSLNTQDWAYPTQSRDTVNRVLDIHTRYGIPLDVFLANNVLAAYEADAEGQALLARLRSSPLVSIAYHTRAPLPYRVSCDWRQLGSLARADLVALVQDYEHHVVDLRTGMPTAAAGGYAHLTALAGAPPSTVGIESDGELHDGVYEAFRTLGARIAVEHTGPANLGRMVSGFYVRPEHYDLWFAASGRHPDEPDYRPYTAQTLVEQVAVPGARAATGARPPYFVGVKMHDNDFFSSASAWTTSYVPRCADGPTAWHPDARAALLTDADREGWFTRYEALVQYVSTQSARLPVVNSQGLLRMLAR